MQRRTLLGLGVAGTTALALAGWGAARWRAGWDGQRLTAEGRAIFAALALALLGPAVKAPAALAAHLDRLDATVAGLPSALRQEFAQLAALLALPAGRVALLGLGADWPQAEPEHIRTALRALQRSSLSLKRQIYQGLRDLTHAAWYADPQAWAAMGYPGPREL